MLWIISGLLLLSLLVVFLQYRKIKLLEKRLLVHGGEWTMQGAFDYSDILVVKGVGLYGDLTGLEYMLRTMVGSYRRQKLACEMGRCQDISPARVRRAATHFREDK